MQPPQGPVASTHEVGVAGEPSPARACAWWAVRARRPARGPSRARGQPRRGWAGGRRARGTAGKLFSYLGIDWQPGRTASGRTATRPREDRDGPIGHRGTAAARARGIGLPTVQVPLCCRLATAYLSYRPFSITASIWKKVSAGRYLDKVSVSDQTAGCSFSSSFCAFPVK
jgi:hypothetical protein